MYAHVHFWTNVDTLWSRNRYEYEYAARIKLSYAQENNHIGRKGKTPFSETHWGPGPNDDREIPIANADRFRLILWDLWGSHAGRLSFDSAMLRVSVQLRFFCPEIWEHLSSLNSASSSVRITNNPHNQYTALNQSKQKIIPLQMSLPSWHQRLIYGKDLIIWFRIRFAGWETACIKYRINKLTTQTIHNILTRNNKCPVRNRKSSVQKLKVHLHRHRRLRSATSLDICGYQICLRVWPAFTNSVNIQDYRESTKDEPCILRQMIEGYFACFFSTFPERDNLSSGRAYLTWDFFTFPFLPVWVKFAFSKVEIS